ncbi:radical SAM family heme chaperone HemW [Candidatus Latescibacterota bacterium]
MSYTLYIHIPFCRHKCPYCNFGSITGAEDLFESYTEALIGEISSRCRDIFDGIPLTIYIGGGTPSLVPASSIANVVKDFSTYPDIEFTVEANPESISKNDTEHKRWLDGIRAAGANRISIGIQSLDDGILKILGRIHNSKQAISSITHARQAGFKNVSIDLMYGIPGQTFEIWEQTLDTVLELQPDHVSGYCLSVEEGTEYFNKMCNGKFQLPEPEKTSDMYILMNELFQKDGLMRYEISNFARAEYECKHNQAYWNFIPYLGVGSSAHSYNGSVRMWNEQNPIKYIKNISSKNNSISGREIIDTRKHLLEKIMLSLRTANGLNLNHLEGLRSVIKNEFINKIKVFENAGFLDIFDGYWVVLTTQGSVLADEIISELVAEI